MLAAEGVSSGMIGNAFLDFVRPGTFDCCLNVGPLLGLAVDQKTVHLWAGGDEVAFGGDGVARRRRRWFWSALATSRQAWLSLLSSARSRAADWASRLLSRCMSAATAAWLETDRSSRSAPEALPTGADPALRTAEARACASPASRSSAGVKWPALKCAAGSPPSPL